MTTPNQAKELIYARAETALTAVVGATGYVFDNERFTPPPPVGDPPVSPAWVRVRVDESLSLQSTLGGVGNRRFERQGTAVFEISAPTDFGTVAADAIVKAIRDAFEGVTVPGVGEIAVYFTNCQVLNLGIEGPSWRVNALASFWFEDRK